MSSSSADRNSVLPLALLLSILAGCQPDPAGRPFAEETTGGTAGLLAGPPEGADIQYAKYAPENPYAEVAPGLLSQTVFDTQGSAAAAGAPRYAVEARNLLVGPGQRTTAATLPGGAVFEVRAGSGSVTIGERTLQITTGSTFAVSEGESFRLANDADGGLALRVYVIRLQ